MPFREPDILGVFLKSGDHVVVGGVRTLGVVDIEGVSILPGESSSFSATEMSVLVKTGVLQLTLKAPVTLEDGDFAGSYTVRAFDPEPPDGALTRVKLLRV